MSKKTYIGDGVYAAYDGYHIVLTTENGIHCSNVIYLEPHMVPLIQQFADKIQQELRDGQAG